MNPSELRWVLTGLAIVQSLLGLYRYTEGYYLAGHLSAAIVTLCAVVIGISLVIQRN